MTEIPFRSMINSGTVDIHIDPYTHTNDYSSEPVSLPYAIPFASWYCYKTQRWDISASPSSQTQLFTMPVSSLTILFSFLVLVFRHPRDQVTLCLARPWWMSSHREGPKNISPIPGGANPNLELSSPSSYVSDEPVSYRYRSPCYGWR